LQPAVPDTGARWKRFIRSKVDGQRRQLILLGVERLPAVLVDMVAARTELLFEHTRDRVDDSLGSVLHCDKTRVVMPNPSCSMLLIRYVEPSRSRRMTLPLTSPRALTSAVKHSIRGDGPGTWKSPVSPRSH